MSISINFRGVSGSSNMNTTDISFSPSGNFSSSSMAVLVIIREANSTQNNFSIDSVTDSNNNKWERLYTTYQTNPWYFLDIYMSNQAETLLTSDTISITFTSSDGYQANCHLLELTNTASYLKAVPFDYRISHNSFSVSSIVVPKTGDIVVCGNFNNASEVITGDSDTTNGSWSSNNINNTTSLYSIIQYKVTTGTSNQNYTASAAANFGSFSFLIRETDKLIHPFGQTGFFGL